MKQKLIGSVVLLAASSLAGFAQTPVVGQGGIVNGASFNLDQPDKRVAPGSLISIFGTNLASSIQLADTIPISTSLGDVQSVTINGIAAPVQFVSPGQINVQLPWEETFSSSGLTNMPVVVKRTNGSTSQPVTAQIGEFSPGIFTVNFGKGQALALIFPDNAVAGPVGSIPRRLTRPAKRGDILEIFATGLGPVVGGPPRDGDKDPSAPQTVMKPVVTIGGITAPVQFSGLSPQFVGLYQVNIQVPAQAPTGDALPLQIEIGGVTSTQQATIAVSAQ